MYFSPGPSPRSRAHGHMSAVRPAAAIATAKAPIGSSHGACGVPPVPPRVIPAIVDLDNEKPMRSSVHRAHAAVLAYTVASVSASAASASAGTAPAAPHYSER